MKKNEHITAFYLETLLLIVVFLSIILVLTNIFGLGRVNSAEAERLNNAVCLAQNTAEAVSESESSEQLLNLLNEDGNAAAADGGVTAYYDSDMRPDPDGDYRVDVTWTPAPGESGTLVSSEILVHYRDFDEPVYTLDTAVYLKEN